MLTKDNELCDCLNSAILVLDPYLDFTRLLARALVEEKPALVGRDLDLDARLIQKLLPFPVPLDLRGLVTLKGQLEDCTLPSFYGNWA